MLLTELNNTPTNKKEVDFLFKEQSVKYEGAVFTGIYLHNFDLSFSEFNNCKFIDCCFGFGQFISSTFNNCEFKNVVFGNCSFTNSVFENVKYISVNFTCCNLDYLKLNNSTLLKVKTTNSDFSNSSFLNCTLTKSKVVFSIFNRNVFNCNDFFKLYLTDCIIKEVEFIKPKNLMWSRELVAALLLQHSEGLMKRERIAELVRIKRNMCWDAWQRYALDEEKILVEWVKNIFALYPDSKLLEAFNNEITFSDN